MHQIERLAAAMYEDRGPGSLEVELRRLLGQLGLEPYSHHCDMRQSHAGFPDWVIAGSRRVLYRELKSEVGVLSPAQRLWRDQLVAAGADWAIWRPSDLLYGRILMELMAVK